MADKDTQDTHKATQPKAKTEYWEHNNLAENLKDIDSYEKLSDDLKFQSPKGDRMETEKHKPIDAHPTIPETDIAVRDIAEENIRGNEGEAVSKEVKKIHEEAPYTAVTNLSSEASSDHALELERKIKDSNKSKGGVKYHGDAGQGESRRTPRTDKHKNIDRTKITDVLAALTDVAAFEFLTKQADKSCANCGGTGKAEKRNPYKSYSADELDNLPDDFEDYGYGDLPADYDGPNHPW